MKKHVIALGRQFGSGGREIGRKLSESLGFAHYDRELLKLAAERAEVGEELFADKDEKAGNPWLFKAFYQGGPKVKQGQSAEDVLFQMQSEIIRELEGQKRGIYGGAIGYLDFGGNLDTCIAIRLAYKKNGRVVVQSGAGIVADSIPENEFTECSNKARAVVAALQTAEGGLR